jgi:putative hydroxymethylpyrimidine transport system substrate-binding protein
MRAAALAVIFLLAVALAACGAGSQEVDREATILLDFTPNAAHVGLYTARARGYDEGESVRIRIRVPGQSTDAVRLLAAEKVDFAVLDIHDLALARQRGVDIVGVMPIVQRPLAAVIARPGTRSPRDLEGRAVGVTGLPSDDAVLRSVVRGAGGDPARVRTVTIGFDAVSALLGGRVPAATAFWDVEGVALRARRPGFRIFRVDAFGAPAYPELVLCALRRTVREQPGLVDGVVAAARRGYEQALQDPESSVEDLVDRARGVRRADVQAQLDAVQSAFASPSGRVGRFDAGTLRAWARWEVRFGIVRRPPDVARAFLLR